MPRSGWLSFRSLIVCIALLHLTPSLVLSNTAPGA